jgi:catechol 2,3-dioxygenase
MALQRVTRAELRVPRIDDCLEFHEVVMGLTVLHREPGRVCLGTGADGTVDLTLVEHEGRSGTTGFSIGVDSRDDLAEVQARLQAMGTPWQRATDPEPGVRERLSCALPAGQVLALVTLAPSEQQYLHPGRGPHPRTRGIAPLDLDHITLRVGDQVRRTIEFLSASIGLKTSDIAMPPQAEPIAAWMRINEYHHDVAMFAGSPTETLDHLAWNVETFENIKRALDLLARHGIDAEAGPGRHGVGGNLYAYFWSPGGNRYELTADMPRMADRNARTMVWPDPGATFSAWGARHPESFKRGS